MTIPSFANTWTGGQYSLFRAVFGAYLFVAFVRRTPFGAEAFTASRTLAGESIAPLSRLLSNSSSSSDSSILITSLLILGAAASVALAIGRRDRIAALVLLAVWASLLEPTSLLANPGSALIGGLLIAHALSPARPFGSWDARDRLDPDSGWRMPNTLYVGAWVLLALGYLVGGVNTALDSTGLEGAGVSVAFLLLHLFTFNPSWIASRHPEGHTVVFYDGACGLCHQTIRFLLAEDASGDRFRFAPLESELFDSTRALPESGFEDGDPIPDSVLVKRPGEAMLVRAEGVLELGRQLGGLWRGLATILGWLPIPLLNAGYDFIASIRHRLFKRPEDACPLLPPQLRDRFSH